MRYIDVVVMSWTAPQRRISMPTAFDRVRFNPAPMFRRRWVRRWFAVLVYLTLALTSTWPLALSATTKLPMGTTIVSTVPLFNLWTIWWNADRATHAFAGYWDAPIFAPTESAFAFSEPQPTTLIVAPIIWLSGSRVLAYNVYLWLSLVLNGVFAERLLRVLHVRWWAAILGGAAMVMLPIVHWQLDVIQLVPVWALLWTWTAAWQASRRPNWQRGAETGLALSVSFLNCGHHALFLGLLLAATVWVLPGRWRDRQLWLAFAAACVVIAVIVGPLAVPMQQVMKQHAFARKVGMVSQLSALPVDYLGASGPALIDFGQDWLRPYWRMSPGWIKVALAAVGIVWGLIRRRSRRFTIFLLLNATLAFTLSMGTHLKIGEWEPWWTLAKHVPGFSQVRNVFRFGYFVHMAVVIWSAQAVWWMSVAARRLLLQRPRWRIAGLGTCVLLGCCAAIEIRPQELLLTAAPDKATNAGWIEFIRSETPPGKSIACLPYPKAYLAGDYEQTTRWMYYGTFHKVPLANGYSGFFPADYFATQDAMNVPQTVEPTLKKLTDSGVHFFVVDPVPGEPDPLQDLTLEEHWLELVFDDPVGVRIYELRPLKDNQPTQPSPVRRSSGIKLRRPSQPTSSQ